LNWPSLACYSCVSLSLGNEIWSTRIVWKKKGTCPARRPKAVLARSVGHLGPCGYAVWRTEDWWRDLVHRLPFCPTKDKQVSNFCFTLDGLYELKGTQNIITYRQVVIKHDVRPVICISIERHLYAWALPRRRRQEYPPLLFSNTPFAAVNNLSGQKVSRSTDSSSTDRILVPR
jgi:hypothetical protein